MKRALEIILGVSLFGLCFSGFLTYREFFHASQAALCTPLGQPGTMFGYPPCVYGFLMYLAIALTASLGLRGRSATGHTISAKDTFVPRNG